MREGASPGLYGGAPQHVRSDAPRTTPRGRVPRRAWAGPAPFPAKPLPRETNRRRAPRADARLPGDGPLPRAAAAPTLGFRLSTRALAVSDPLAPVRYLDVVLVVLAAPFVVVFGVPLRGYLVAAGVWLVQRLVEAATDRRAARAEVRGAIGLKFASMLGRTWMVGVAIIAVGLAGEREDGFVAAVVCLAAYTVHLATQIILRPLDSKRA